MHPILGVLAGCFIGSQGLWNAIIYFRPKYNKIDKDHWWQKIWVLIRSTLLCCVDFSAIGISLATTASSSLFAPFKTMTLLRCKLII